MIKLQDLTKASFEPQLGASFRLHAAPSLSVACTLIEVTGLVGTVGGREPFSLVFRAPPNLRLPQAIYRLENEALGRLDLFLVPIGPNASGMCYEAVFT